MKSMVWQWQENKYAFYFQEAGYKAEGYQTDHPVGTNQLEIHRPTSQHFYVIPGGKEKKKKKEKKAEIRQQTGKWRYSLGGEAGVEWGIWKVISRNLLLLTISVLYWSEREVGELQSSARKAGSRQGSGLAEGKGKWKCRQPDHQLW